MTPQHQALRLDGHAPSPAARSILAGPAPLILALGVYLVAELLNLRLPGLYFDEALDAVPAIQWLHGAPLDITAHLTLFGREWPLMVMTYVGPTTTYLVAPVFAIFGASVEALRLVNIGLGALSLLLAWGFLRELIDPRVAGIATLLLALNPAFLFWTRMGAFVSLPMLPLSIGAMWALYRWRQRGRDRYLVGAAFCLGLGLTTKIVFLWFWGALVLAWLVLSPWLERGKGWRAWLWPLRLATPRSLVIAALALLLGLAPLLAFNLQSLGTFATVLENAGENQLYSSTSLDLLGNLTRVRAEDLRGLLDGSWLARISGLEHRNLLAAPALLLSIGVLAWLALRDRLPYGKKRFAFLSLMLIAIYLESAVTVRVSGPSSTHLMMLWPIPQALVAMALVALPALLPAARRSALLAVAVVLGLTLVGAEAWTSLRYGADMVRTGGTGSFSDAIYALEADLQAAGTERPVALDWGFRRTLQLLSGGAINPEERFDYAMEPGDWYADWIDDRVNREAAGQAKPSTYLFHAPGFVVFGDYWPAFEEAAYRRGMQPVAKAYLQRDGRPVYLAYHLEPASPITALPATATSVDGRLGDGMRLLGYEVANPTVRPGETFTMTLYWQADTRQAADYKVFAHLIGDDGSVAGMHDSVPRLWGYPTTKWEAGEVIADRVRIPVSPDAQPQVYRVFVGMYDAATGERVPFVVNGRRLEGDTLGIVETHSGD